MNNRSRYNDPDCDVELARLRARGRLSVALVGLLTPLVLAACGPAVRRPTDFLVLEPHQQNYPAQVYRIQQGDELDIKFFDNPDLTERDVVVRPDGRISLQLAHDIMAVDKTPQELADAIAEAYKGEVARPRPAVGVRVFNGQKAYVAGEVEKAQLVPLTGKTTVLQAIAAAGGFKDSARLDQVILVRRADAARPMAVPLDLSKVIDGTDMRQDLFLLPHDIVFVPKSPIANVNQWVEQVLINNIPVRFGVGLTYDVNQ
jgi:protein involved in polysaccharide export with SLBB domain